MADISLLKALYADLTDDQIIYKLLHESHLLTPDAIQVAKNELAKRQINFETLKSEKELEQLQQKKYEHFKSLKKDTEISTLIRFVIEAKNNGKENITIIDDFEKQGIEKDISISLIKEAKQKCKDIIDNNSSDLFYGGIIAFAGIVLAIFVRRISDGNIIFLPYGAILFGSIKFLSGLGNFSNKKKMAVILKRFS